MNQTYTCLKCKKQVPPQTERRGLCEKCQKIKTYERTTE